MSLECVELNHVKQWISIRGNASSNRILLFLHGGPGSPLFPLANQIRKVTRLEDMFLVVYWEQRGTGKSLDRNLQLTLEDLYQDTITLSELLRDRYSAEKIYLVAHSFGTLLGMVAVHRRPDLFRAYLAVAQIGDAAQIQKDSYEFALTKAKLDNNNIAIEQISKIHPLTSDASEITIIRGWVKYYHGSRYKTSFSYGGWIKELLKTREYTWRERYRVLKYSNFSLEQLAAQFGQVNLTTQVREIKVPVHFVTGAHDFVVSTASSYRYYQQLDAPAGNFWHDFTQSAHYPFLEEPERFNEVLARLVET